MLQYISIPAGMPPVRLPLRTPVTVGDLTVGDLTVGDLTVGSSGLLTGSEALSQAIPTDAAGTSRRVAKLRAEDIRATATQLGLKPGECLEYLPTDKEIVAWAHEVREFQLNKGDYLLVEALQYWVRYTFETFSPEHRLVSEKLATLVRDVKTTERPVEATPPEPSKPDTEEKVRSPGRKPQRPKLSRQHYVKEGEGALCSSPVSEEDLRIAETPLDVTCKRCLKLLREEQEAGAPYLMGVEFPDTVPEGEPCPVCGEFVQYTRYCKNCPAGG